MKNKEKARSLPKIIKREEVYTSKLGRHTVLTDEFGHESTCFPGSPDCGVPGTMTETYSIIKSYEDGQKYRFKGTE